MHRRRCQCYNWCCCARLFDLRLTRSSYQVLHDRKSLISFFRTEQQQAIQRTFAMPLLGTSAFGSLIFAAAARGLKCVGKRIAPLDVLPSSEIETR